MKQYEYMTRFDKDVFESRKPHYTIEVTTDNYACYQAINDGVNDIISEYEEAEANNPEEKSDAD